MSSITSIKAAKLPPTSLPTIPRNRLCSNYIEGFCKEEEECRFSHEICIVPTHDHLHPVLNCLPNYLSLEPRGSTQDRERFDDDGPGVLSSFGPRHDNDHLEIIDIRILPTVDEILSIRYPYVPKKNPQESHYFPPGQNRLLDIHFRQLRYDSVEPIIDSCYHASQQLQQIAAAPLTSDYDSRVITPRGFRYSLYRDVKFEELAFTEKKSITGMSSRVPYNLHGIFMDDTLAMLTLERGKVRVSFACPKALRGRRLGPSKYLEDGMIVALVGSDLVGSLSITFMEIVMRQSTEAMRPRTGNDLRGKHSNMKSSEYALTALASAVLSFADGNDIEAVRRLLYNAQGFLQEKFVLVEIPSTLYAGFYWTLKQLQLQSEGHQQLALIASIAPEHPGTDPGVSPPKFTGQDGFAYKLDVLRTQIKRPHESSLVLRPATFLSNTAERQEVLDVLRRKTTLDDGQALALCENLCRDLAFTQGPPGTGKTYLGVALVRVLLNSKISDPSRPILVVCMTNHALDSFLDNLRNDQWKIKMARLGRASKEGWTDAIQLSTLVRQQSMTTAEKKDKGRARHMTEALSTEGASWCEALNSKTLGWPAVRELLKARYPDVLKRFTDVEKFERPMHNDMRLARKAGGFAFEYWSDGGDITDIDRLLQKFDSMLGNNLKPQEDKADDIRLRVIDTIFMNAQFATEHRKLNADDVWNLDLSKRQSLLKDWAEEINIQSILDRTAEIHRRHQVALSTLKDVYRRMDARCLAEQNVVGMTTTACAMNWATLNEIGIKTVICEEAGEVMEAQFLCTLFSSLEHAISIGGKSSHHPLQLRPQVNEPALSLETDAGASYRLDESLMERLMIPPAGTNPIPSSRLSIQRRMHPEIAEIMRATLYPFLEDHQNTHDRAPVPVMANRVWWFDHKMPEDVPDPRSSMAKSFSNAFEVEMVAGLVEHLVKSNEYEFKDITILTPYNGQLAAFTQRFKGVCSLWLSDKDRAALYEEGMIDSERRSMGSKTDFKISSMLRMATIDNFQGEESRVVILSTVRSNSEGQVGFLKTANRINVGCSRAMNGFYIVGNASLMKGVRMWETIIENLKARGKIGSELHTCCPRHPDQTHSVSHPEQWKDIPECRVPCSENLSCGHPCSMNCHAPSLHERAGCDKPCPQILYPCRHQCMKTCGEDCGDCTFALEKVILPCGHEVSKTCAEVRNGDAITCTVPMEPIQLTCRHWVDRVCSTAHERPKCKTKCDIRLGCKHYCGGNCHECTINGIHQKCVKRCSNPLPCGHTCVAPCHIGEECPRCEQRCQKSCNHRDCNQPCFKLCEPCVRPCDWTCPHDPHDSDEDGYACQTMCCLPCNRLPCNERCTETLACGHGCPSLCGEKCPERCLYCSLGSTSAIPQMFLPCGHTFDLGTLDNHVGISSLYDIDINGRVRMVQATFASALPDLNLRCPACGADCKSLRRYMLCNKLTNLEDTLDRLYAKISGMLFQGLKLVHKAKSDLDHTFERFSTTLKPGPLAGGRNEVLIRNRGDSLITPQAYITNLRDHVALQLDNDLKRIETFLGIEPTAHDNVITSAYSIRLDMLFYRTRLIALEEGLRILQKLQNMNDPARHVWVTVARMQGIIIDEAKGRIKTLKYVIVECDNKNLKRLEAEARLIQMAMHILLNKLGVTSDVDIDLTCKRTLDLCEFYPHTAGLLSSAYNATKKAVNSSGGPGEMYTQGSSKAWWSWPRWHVGDLRHCGNGHPFSGITWTSCPECEPKVQKAAPKAAPKNPNDNLYNDAFLAAMRNTKDNPVYSNPLYNRKGSK